MEFSNLFKGREAEIARLFERTFTASEGAEEGALIGGLARDQMARTADGDIHVVTASDGGTLVGGAIFTRLNYENDTRSVFILGPVAIAPDRQGEGIGQALLTHGLDTLRTAGIDVALTYGDPGFYSRVGFAPITETDVPAPFPLQHPEGWLGQSLTGAALAPLRGPARCVEAFDDPVFW
jgi:predicted N-acetyltransferase YhbS